MNLPDLADPDLVTLPSAHGTTETVERVKALLAQKGIELFAHIDHAGGARKVRLPLRPTQVLIFGNSKAGTPLMEARQTIGLDQGDPDFVQDGRVTDQGMIELRSRMPFADLGGLRQKSTA